MGGQAVEISDGSIVVAAITSCTNTSNPSVMLAAGLVAKKAAALGLKAAPWVKTSLGPGSMAVTRYLDRAGLTEPLKALGFHNVGYGCTVCIGNTGPLPAPVSKAIADHDLCAVSILSGNRNFEGRVHAEVRMNYLASPPLVVAYAIAGRIDLDPYKDPLTTAPNGQPVYLKDIWPTQDEVNAAIAENVTVDEFTSAYADVYAGDARWQSIDVAASQTYAWPADSTYIRNPPYFDGMTLDVAPAEDIAGARCLAVLGDSITTDHISPAGSIKPNSPAGKYLIEKGVDPKDFNSLGSRRGNHEVMMRGTFANIRLRNLHGAGHRRRRDPASAGRRGDVDLRRGNEVPSRGDAGHRDRREGIRLGLLARLGREGTASLGRARRDRRELRAHPSLEPGRHGHPAVGIPAGRQRPIAGPDRDRDSSTSPGWTNAEAKSVTVRATVPDGSMKTFKAKVRIDTPNEVDYYRHGGILPYVLRRLAA